MYLLDELKEYCKQVKTGKIAACQKHKWACLRFESDLERRGTKEFPYEFEPLNYTYTENHPIVQRGLAKAGEKYGPGERFLNYMRMFKHRKGILKGQYIEPDIIQKFIFGNVYGWYHKDTKYRRFKKLYWQVARKNAKSQSLACVGTYETGYFLGGDAPEASEVYIAATKTEQAKIVYDEAVAMVRSEPELKDAFRVAYGRITHEKTGSVMRALSEEDRKTGDGLNPQCGIIDEYHAHETSEIYDVIDSGMGARAQPLLAVITTAGFDLNNPCFRVEYDLCSKILNPDCPVALDWYFVMINELEKNDTLDTVEINGRKVAPGDLIDDIRDESVWVKANPIICSYPEGQEYLRKKVQEAQEAPEKMRNLLTKHMDVWVNQREFGYMVMEKWAACKGELPDLAGQPCYLGLDLSAKIDLTSVAFEFRVNDLYVVLSHSFIPEETFEAKRKSDRVPYDLWVRDGWITLLPGAMVDYRAVKKWVMDYAKERGYRIQEWCLDPWGATQLTNDLQDEGETAVEIVQGIKTLSEPTKDFRGLVYQRRVIHDGNPVLSWAIGNAIADEVDRNQNLLLNKKKSRERIDPIAAVINAHVRAMVAEESVYNQRGLRSLSS